MPGNARRRLTHRGLAIVEETYQLLVHERLRHPTRSIGKNRSGANTNRRVWRLDERGQETGLTGIGRSESGKPCPLLAYLFDVVVKHPLDEGDGSLGIADDRSRRERLELRR